MNNRLISVTQRDGDVNGTITGTQANTYTADGTRVQRTDDTDVTNFYYQGDVLLYTTDEDGDKLCQNIIGPQDNIIATIHYDNEQHAYFYNKDIRTSVTNIVDESGNGVVCYQYDDYGTTTKYGNTGFYNEICYTSGVYDETTGMYYLNARYYDPEDQIFMTQDTYRGEQTDAASWNLYAYCGGNPINYVDPSGHYTETIYKIKLTVKTDKSDSEKTKFAKALYKISNKKKFKRKYKIFKIKAARKVLVAQAAWESGYGTSSMAVNNYNLFGLGGYNYKSLKSSIKGYGWQINNSTIEGYVKARNYLKKHNKDIRGYLMRFAGTYCTSESAESYTQRIMSMISSIKNRGVWR